MQIWSEIRSSFKKVNNLIRLIYINIAVFLFLTVVGVIGFLLANTEIPTFTLNLLSVPSSIKDLLLRPWTLITYMFVHKNIWHILFNMLWLYWFGKIFLEYLDQRKLVAVYLLGGIAGALVYIFSFNIFPAFEGIVEQSVAIGASASVLAIVIAISVYIPDYYIILFLLGRVKIKYMALAIFVMTSILDFSTNSGGKLAHIGGALFGLSYALKLKQGRDIGKGLNRIIDHLATIFKPRKNIRVTYRKPADDYEYNKQKTEHQAEINKILDKISKGGYDSLTKEEREILFKESQKKN